MKIAIASGKGGTGKTTLAVNLAFVAGEAVQLVDCDVEAPNIHLFVNARKVSEDIVTIPVPVINEKLCNGCGECSRFCEYNAIASLGGTPLVFAEMCHGCGGCMQICEQSAITEIGRRIGTVHTSEAGAVTLIHGCLDIGVAMAPPLIKAVKRNISENALVILDAPPGTTCPAVAAISGVDYVVLVTEPTPFGLNDLKLAVDMTRELQRPFGVVINRAGTGNNGVHCFCREQGIPLLQEIPDDCRAAKAYSRGEVIVETLPGYEKVFRDLLSRIKEMVRCSNEGVS